MRIVAIASVALFACSREATEIVPIAREVPATSAVDAPLDVAGRHGAAFTTHGPDQDGPALSPDGRMFAFVRRRLGDPSERRDLWLVREGDAPRVLVEGGPNGTDPYLAGLSSPKFLSDSESIVFSATVATATTGVFVTDLTGRVRLVSDGRLIGEIVTGNWKGLLFIEQPRLDWKHSVGSPEYRGRIERYAVVSKSGREIHAFGDDAAAAFAEVGR